MRRALVLVGAFETAGDALLGGVEVVLPARAALHFDQDVEAHELGDRFSQALLALHQG